MDAKLEANGFPVPSEAIKFIRGYRTIISPNSKRDAFCAPLVLGPKKAGSSGRAEHHSGEATGPWLADQGHQACTVHVNSDGIHITFDVDQSTSLLDWEYLPEQVQKKLQEIYGLPDSCLTFGMQMIRTRLRSRAAEGEVMSMLADLMNGGAIVILRQDKKGNHSVLFRTGLASSVSRVPADTRRQKGRRAQNRSPSEQWKTDWSVHPTWAAAYVDYRGRGWT